MEMVLEKMLAGLQERRKKLGEIRLVVLRSMPVDDGGDIDRLLGRFLEASQGLLDEIGVAEKRSREWFGEKKDVGD